MRGLTKSDVNFLSPYSGEFIHHTHFSTILGVVGIVACWYNYPRAAAGKQEGAAAAASSASKVRDPCHL